MFSRRKTMLSLLILLLTINCLVASSVAAQTEVEQLNIRRLDATEFPDVTLYLVASDLENNPIIDLSGITLRENDFAITDFALEQVSAASEIVFVIDANSTIEQIDEAGGRSRREKVTEGVINFANHYMDPLGMDRVSIVVPDGEGGRFLGGAGMTSPNDLIDAISSYETGPLGQTPLNQMIELALGQTEGEPDEDRVATIVLFTDGAELNAQLEFETLVERAQAAEVAIYAVILGSRADPNEVENVTQLTSPTGGAFVHMPDPADADALFESMVMQANQTQIMYRSGLNQSGRHRLAVELDGARDEVTMDLTIEPPVVSLTVDHNRPILREADRTDIPLDEIEPGQQTLTAQVVWPDGYVRTITAASLLVDGEEIRLEAPVLGADGLMTFDWDIRDLDNGTYDLRVRVTDELGLAAESESVPMVIEVSRPEAAATATIEIVSTSVPDEQAGDLVGRLRQSFAAIGPGTWLLVLLVAVLLLILLVVFFRRGGRAKEESPEPEISDTFDPQADFAVLPEHAIGQASGAYLEVLEHAPEHMGLIPVTGNNVALGRDPNVVQILFDDKSVSRLHARIIESQGKYRIYDEGSASGTYVNFNRIGLSPKMLGDQDDVHLGRVHLRFHLTLSHRPGGSDQTQEKAAKS